MTTAHLLNCLFIPNFSYYLFILNIVKIKLKLLYFINNIEYYKILKLFNFIIKYL